jgi:hypothetical protein
VGERLGITVRTHLLDAVDPRDGLDMSLYGAVLVRPDGHIAWRMPWIPQDPAASLAQALTSILGQDRATAVRRAA